MHVTLSCTWRHRACDVIICGDFIKDVFEVTKVQAESNTSQHLDTFGCCYMDLQVFKGGESSSQFQWFTIA